MNIIHRQSFVEAWKNYAEIYYFNGDSENGFFKQKVPYYRVMFSDSNFDKYFTGHNFDHIHTECYNPNEYIKDFPEEYKEIAHKNSPHYQGLLCKNCGCYVKGEVVSDSSFNSHIITTEKTSFVYAIYLSDSGYSIDNLYMKGYVPPSCNEIVSKEQYIMMEALR